MSPITCTAKTFKIIFWIIAGYILLAIIGMLVAPEFDPPFWERRRISDAASVIDPLVDIYQRAVWDKSDLDFNQKLLRASRSCYRFVPEVICPCTGTRFLYKKPSKNIKKGDVIILALPKKGEGGKGIGFNNQVGIRLLDSAAIAKIDLSDYAPFPDLN